MCPPKRRPFELIINSQGRRVMSPTGQRLESGTGPSTKRTFVRARPGDPAYRIFDDVFFHDGDAWLPSHTNYNYPCGDSCNVEPLLVHQRYQQTMRVKGADLDTHCTSAREAKRKPLVPQSLGPRREAT